MKFKMIICLVVFSFGNFVSAGSMAGVDFLNIDNGSKTTAMGGAGTATHNIETIFYNSAGIGDVKKIALEGNYSLWIEDVSYLNMAFALPIKKVGVLGISAFSLLYGDLPVIKLNQAGEPYKLGNTIKASSSFFSIAYAKQLGKFISAGMNFKLVLQSIADYNATAFAIDPGILVSFLQKKMNFGISLQNFGTKLKLQQSTFSLPLKLNTGVSCQVLEKKSGIGLEADLGMIAMLGNELNFKTGFELQYKKWIALRIGYKINHDIISFTYGAGLNYYTDTYVAGLQYSGYPLQTFGWVHQFGFVLYL